MRGGQVFGDRFALGLQALQALQALQVKLDRLTRIRERLGRGVLVAGSGSRTGELETEIGPDGKLVRAGSLLVTFRGNAQKSTSDAANRQAGSHAVESIGTGRSVRVQVQPGTVAQAMATYASRSDVERVEPDYIVSASMVPNDPKCPETWGLPKIGAPTA